MTDARDIVEQLRLDAERQVAWHSNYARAQQANEAANEIASLREENATLAAGSCDVDGGKIGDEHGHFYCTLQVENASLRKQLEDARSEALEEAAECAERYPSPMNDLPMALAIRSVAKAIRALKGKS